MRIAITGGTGFVGRHLARALSSAGHEVMLIARGMDRRDEGIRRLAHATFVPAGIGDAAKLAEVFQGCDGVAHCAGINREVGSQTFQQVHVVGTRNVVNAARQVRVQRILFLSFLRARPSCGSPYHESKWVAEEIVRSSGLEWVVLKAGPVYGRGDHTLDHVSRSLRTFPMFPLVGMHTTLMRPLAVADLVRVAHAFLVDGRLRGKTVALMGPEAMELGEVVGRIARVIGRRPRLLHLPVSVNMVFAWAFERVMTIPLVSKAQVRILAEGAIDPLPACDELPADLVPSTYFTDEQIQKGLPDERSFGLKDLRWFA